MCYYILAGGVMKKKLTYIIPGGILLVLWIIYLIMPLGQQKITAEFQKASGQGQFLALSQGNVQYQMVLGEGPAVLLVSGFSVPYYCFDSLFEELSSRGFTVIRYNHYGRGLSSRVQGPYTLELYENQLAQFIEALELDKPLHLVGLSMGGLISSRYAVHHPQAIKTLSLISPSGYDIPDSFATRLVKLPVLGDFIMRVFGTSILAGRNSGNLSAPEKYPEFQSQFEEQFQYRGFKEALLSSLRHAPFTHSPGIYKELGNTDFPIQVFWGELDGVLPYEHTDLLRADVPRAEIFTVKNAGHNSQYEEPQQILDVLIQYL